MVSDSVWPHRWQPTRLPHPWDSLGKNTGVGCHFLLQCMKVKSKSEVAQLCPTPSNPMDCSPPDSSIHAIFQARVLEWGAIAFSQTYYLVTYNLYVQFLTLNSLQACLPSLNIIYLYISSTVVYIYFHRIYTMYLTEGEAGVKKLLWSWSLTQF